MNHVASHGQKRQAPNRLAREASPYLQQHQFNPVDWYPWGEEAFARARAEDKPIFLSIGYSTCHWCHVMERESFENEEIAAVLNRHFVSIKVDREERPDVDHIHMTAVQALAGQGGWPLSVFLTPELRPFFGGTYFPPTSRHGRPGFLELLEQIARVWRQRRPEVENAAATLQQQLAGWLAQRPAERPLFHEGLLATAAEELKADYDAAHGGFGGAPKFPQPAIPQYLLEYGMAYGDRQARDMVLHTCAAMARGGIHDQLGGGFARYAVDAEWTVPHFEKMLYDNAQLLDLYVDAWRASGEASLAEVARGIVRYVLRDMTHPAGGFYSAEDADSEGHEGKFYCWTLAECRSLLPPEELAVVVKHYGLTEEGNFLDHSHPQPLRGLNVLRVCREDLSAEEAQLLAQARARLLAARERRVRPLRDEKVLASWNGLMCGALARAGRGLNLPEALAAARRNAAFVRQHLWDAPRRRLHHRWRDGERDNAQLLKAYAYQAQGHLALYEATLEPEALAFAATLAEVMLERFHDPEQGGFWESEAAPELILRVKDSYDGAEPSGNSVAALALLKLAQITGQERYQEAAAGVLRLFCARMQKVPAAHAHLWRAAALFVRPALRLEIVGEPSAADTQALLQAAHETWAPWLVLAGRAAPGPACAHLCQGQSCGPRLTSPAAVQQALLEMRAGR
ncbi:thioredoxin domain-containing protein [Fontisphaera persica]|uniref:thioredoxin domain-containing protein n=1 Tax=Fontisphaera persica TaxID=2974023 RepID=UPI0024C01D2F|nr:thioredoxin domain-containing protein [Fontisphaera persica]WCJ58946.1 thioredoxin domain-containing protein [Fontisphaera persica]